MVEKVPDLKKRSSSGELKLENLPFEKTNVEDKKEGKREERKIQIEKKDTYKSSLNL